jgi:hypothetical protein
MALREFCPGGDKDASASGLYANQQNSIDALTSAI